MTDDARFPTSAEQLPIVWWAQILAGSSDARFIRNGAGSETYVALPRPDRATVVIDARSGPAIADAVGKAGQGALRSLAGKVLRIPGLATTLPGKLTLETSESTLRERLGEIVGVDARLSASCGPLRPNRKPVVRVLDGKGALRSVGKVGWDALTAQLITTEGQALARLNTLDTSSMIVPDVVSHETWRGLEVLVVSPLPIDPSIEPTLSVGPTLDALRDIAAIERTTVDSVSSSGFWNRLASRLPDLERYDLEGSDLEGTDLVGSDLGSTDPSLDIGGFHGDWSPWNTQPQSDGSLLVWDWERHATDVPVGVDLVHFLFQTERFIDQRTPLEARPAVVRRAKEHLPALDVSPDLADLLIDFYLLEALARNSEGALSTKLAERRQSLVDALSPRAQAFQHSYSERYPRAGALDSHNSRKAA